MSIHSHRGLSHDLSERGVGVYRHPELLRRPLNELGEDALCYEVRHVRPDSVHPEDQIGLGVGPWLRRPHRGPPCSRFPGLVLCVHGISLSLQALLLRLPPISRGSFSQLLGILKNPVGVCIRGDIRVDLCDLSVGV